MNRKLNALTAVFCVCLIVSNLFEAKIFLLGPLTLTGGFLVFPIVYIVNDILSEIYGFRETRRVVWLAFLLNLAFLGLVQLVRWLPAAPYCDAQPHFDYFFATDLRMTVASMAAFLLGSILNAKVMSAMRARQGDKGFGWRAVLSSLAGEAVDSAIFFPIAFYNVGWANMLVMMLTQIVLKTGYEIIVLPLTWRVVRRLKKQQAAVSGQAD